MHACRTPFSASTCITGVSSNCSVRVNYIQALVQTLVQLHVIYQSLLSFYPLVSKCGTRNVGVRQSHNVGRVALCSPGLEGVSISYIQYLDYVCYFFSGLATE
jgi:hypothetical protein